MRVSETNIFLKFLGLRSEVGSDFSALLKTVKNLHVGTNPTGCMRTEKKKKKKKKIVRMHVLRAVLKRAILKHASDWQSVVYHVPLGKMCISET